jgi:phage virion morphogenesis protein
MAGGFVSVDVTGSSSIVNAFNRLIKNIDDTSPALRDIGEYLTESTQQRFEDMETPDGEKWEELALGTIAKKKRVDRILTESGTLADTLNYQLGNDQLMFGSNLEYAATHQFGRDNANIPAREFLGFSEQDEDEILAIFHQYLSND